MARIGNRQHGALGEVERQNALFEEREKRQELKHILHMKTNGKSICATLKQVRKCVADTNGIVYTPKECHFEGDCNGTCPACEAEVRYINSQLGRFRLAGKAVKVAGLALGITMATGNVQQSAACVNARPNVDANGGELMNQTTG